MCCKYVISEICMTFALQVDWKWDASTFMNYDSNKCHKAYVTVSHLQFTAFYDETNTPQVKVLCSQRPAATSTISTSHQLNTNTCHEGKCFLKDHHLDLQVATITTCSKNYRFTKHDQESSNHYKSSNMKMQVIEYYNFYTICKHF